MLKENPVKNGSREELVLYLCGLHNIVNERLGKAIFDCKRAFEFWGGNCGCSQAENNSHEEKKIDTKNNFSFKVPTPANSNQSDKQKSKEN